VIGGSGNTGPDAVEVQNINNYDFVDVTTLYLLTYWDVGCFEVGASKWQGGKIGI